MAYNVYKNPTGVTIGSTTLTGVVAITVGTTYSEIHARADGEAHETVARAGAASTRGTIAFVDPTQAESAKGEQGTLAFTWTDVKGSTNKSVSITNASIVSWDSNVSMDGASSASAAFIAEAAPSIT